MATVHLAASRRAGGFTKLLVLKVLRAELAQDTEFRSMFVDEARVAARLNHPNVVHTYEVGEDGAELFIAMEYLDGAPLSALLRKAGRRNVPLPVILRALTDILSGLEAAHTLAAFDGTPTPIVHRDVSPQNVFLERSGQVKLLDFGIAKVAGSNNQTKAGVLKGKVGYMAPEQIANRAVDARTDVFAVGVMLWEALAGRRLVGAGDNELAAMTTRINGRDPPVRSVAPEAPAGLCAICDRAMAARPEDRYGSAADLREALLSELTSFGAAGGNGAVAEVVKTYFDDERAQLQRTIEARLHAGAGGETGPGEGRDSESRRSGVRSSTTPALTSDAHPPARSRLLRIGAIAAILGLVGAAIAVRRGGAPPKADAPADPKSQVLGAPQPTAAAIIATPAASASAGWLSIRLTPAWATLTLDGVVVQPPYRISTSPGHRYRLVATAIGYAPGVQVVDGGPAGSTREVVITLVAQAGHFSTPAHSAPSAEPSSAGEAPSSHKTKDSRHHIDDQDPYNK